MRRSSPGRFAFEAGALSVLSAMALAVGLKDAASDASRWAAAGFLAMALPIIAAGAWLVREHGRTGAVFMIALGGGLVLRGVLLAAIVAAAAKQGSGALTGALAGLAVGFVPLTAFEMLWFIRRSRRPDASREARV